MSVVLGHEIYSRSCFDVIYWKAVYAVVKHKIIVVNKLTFSKFTNNKRM